MDRMARMEENFEKYTAREEERQKNNDAFLKNLQIQIGQLCDKISQDPKPFSASTITNPIEHCNAITTRGGKVVGHFEKEQEVLVESEGEKNKESTNTSGGCENMSDESLGVKEDQREGKKILGEKGDVIFGGGTSGKKKKGAEKEKSKIETPQIKQVPYPLNPTKRDKERQYARFLDIFKHLNITIPFLDALKEMPAYAKFIKNLLTRKKPYEEDEVVQLNSVCSAVIQQDLPLKKSDPGSFTTPVTMGTYSIRRALLDLGASINVMPLSIAKRLGNLEIQSTGMALRLADGSMKIPYGVAPDVLVTIGKFTFPVDFVILDVEEDPDIPIILGRPFLDTSGAKIDVPMGEVTFRVEDRTETIQACKKTPILGPSPFIKEGIMATEVSSKGCLEESMKSTKNVKFKVDGDDEKKKEFCFQMNDPTKQPWPCGEECSRRNEEKRRALACEKGSLRVYSKPP